MPTIHVLPLGSYQTNTYIVTGNGKTCAVIDPGFEPETILARVKDLGLTVDAILLTHGHFDHVGGVMDILDTTGCTLWMHKADHAMPNETLTNYIFPLANRKLPNLSLCQDGDEISAGGLTFRILATPGHTPGSVCYLCGDALFSGDTLFAGSCGRTDLPGGSWDAIQESLLRLALLEEDLSVYPGHGGATTLNRERKYNPYMR